MEDAKQFAWIWSFYWISLLFLYVSITVREFSGDSGPWILKIPVDLFSNIAGGSLLACYLKMVYLYPHSKFWWFKIYIAIGLITVTPVIFNITFQILKMDSANGFITTINGIFGGVTMALLVGRLESKFIASPIWILALLYAYAVLQGTYSIVAKFQNDDTKQLAFVLIINAAFVLKLVFYWHIRNIITSGRLVQYMRSYRALSTSPLESAF